VSSVRCHDECRADLFVRCAAVAAGVADREPHSFLVLADPDDLRAPADLAPAQAGKVAGEHLFEVILRHPGRGRRADHGALRQVGHVDRHPCAVPGLCGGAGLQEGEVDLVGPGPQVLLQPPAAEDLHLPDGHSYGPGERGHLGPLVEHEHVEAVAGQLRGGDQAGRSGTDNHDVMVGQPDSAACHVVNPFSEYSMYDEMSIKVRRTGRQANTKKVVTARGQFG
jgi:hypothetical protein